MQSLRLVRRALLFSNPLRTQNRSCQKHARPSSAFISCPSKLRRQFTTRASAARSIHHDSTSALDDTIYALSTAPGRAAIAVIRISGPACLSIYQRLCPNKTIPNPRSAALRQLRSPVDHERTLDTGALLLYFPSPKTVTGEDILELHIHGGPAIVRSVLEAIQQCAPTRIDTGRRSLLTKIRPAEAGEFTKRAFYNGRIDLTEVEALGEALAAETEQQRRLAVSGAATGLTQRYEEWRNMLLYARGELEALIDFSEDQHFDESPAQFMASISKQVMDLKKRIALHVSNATRGELLRSGISVALLGAPNAGKSSLLNRIVGREAAIVSAEEGTTRDIVDVSIDMQGWLVRLGDMAGLRAEGTRGSSTSVENFDAACKDDRRVGEIEREGIRRARERAIQSDLVIVLISLQPTMNGTVELALNDELVQAAQECHDADKNMLFAINKMDLLHTQTATRKVSISRLLSGLVDAFPKIDPNDVFCLSCRDADSLNSEESDAGGLQTFVAGLVKKFSTMTSAAARSDDAAGSTMSAAEAQNYWTASLSVTHRQSQFLQDCLVHLQSFLESSAPDTISEDPIVSITPLSTITRARTSIEQGFFDTLDTEECKSASEQHYHIDNHDDLVAEVVASDQPEIPYSWSRRNHPDFNGIADEEFDIVTAAEHLRNAADSLSKLTGRGDGVTSGADVEDVLGVVFEKFCVGK